MRNCRCSAGLVFVVFGLVMIMGCSSGVSNSDISISPSAVLLAPGQTFQFAVARIGNSASSTAPQPVYTVNGVAGGSSSTGTITSSGIYTAPSTATTQGITVGIQGQTSTATVTLFNNASVTPGSVTATQNPLVASYSITAPAATPVQVQFGPDTSYGFNTSTVTAPPAGGTVTILVAGMRASTTYHMQAVIDLTTGSQALDTDQTFTTGAIPADRLPNLTTQFPGTPSSGIELLSLLPETSPGSVLNAVATDLEGNVIWYYDLGSTEWPYPIKPLANGHMLLNVAPDDEPAGENEGTEIREIDLAGNTINSATATAVNQSLQQFGASFQILGYTHDVAVLPNGHWILLANYQKTISDVSGIPNGTVMLGDVLIDWDVAQQAVVWTWDAFDHVPLTHAPYGFADWTHGNAIIYSPDDQQLILSMRDQNWLAKINYTGGTGDGSVLWYFGPGGDFTLAGDEAPIDWNYGQHYPSIVSANSSGVFSLMFFDNGNNRLVDSNNDVCGASGQIACYSSVPIFQLDEATKTATLQWQDNLLASYSICCGDALVLPSGNVEFDVAYDLHTPGESYIEEVTQTGSPQLLWKMAIYGQLAYRGFRIPSLYPGVSWPAAVPSPGDRGQLRHTGSTTKSKTPPVPKTIDQLP